MHRQLVSAVGWSAADILVRQGVQFGISIVLARLLSPEEFGTIALLYLFVGIAGVIADGGLPNALIQRQDTTPADNSTVFWLNLGVGLLMALLFWLSGPWIAALYGIPVLSPLAGVMALTVLAGAVGAVPRALLHKAMTFRPLVFANLVSVLLSGTVAIWLAFAGWGIWALAAQALVSALVTMLLTWIVSPWRPAMMFSAASFRRLFGFGGYLLASALLDTLYYRLYTLLLGRFYGVTQLGYYTRADTTAQMPSAILNGIIARVAFPLFSRIADDPSRVRTNLRLALRGTMLVHAPVMFGLAAVSAPVVLLLFGEKWLPAVPFLQILCLVSLLTPLHVLNLQALLGMGRSDLFFRLEVVKKLVGIFILVLALAFGPIGIAWAMVAGGVAFFVINAHCVGTMLSYGPLEQIRDIVPAIGAAAAMGLAVAWFCDQLPTWPTVQLLAVAVAGGALSYGLMALLVPAIGVAQFIRIIRRTPGVSPRTPK